jgi:hypothetical protein
MTDDKKDASGTFMSPAGMERRDSLRATTTVRVLVEGWSPIERKGIVSLKNVFLEGAGALDDGHEGKDGRVEFEASDGALSLPMRIARPQGRPEAGWVLAFAELDFEEERRLARFLDENKRAAG